MVKVFASWILGALEIARASGKAFQISHRASFVSITNRLSISHTSDRESQLKQRGPLWVVFALGVLLLFYHLGTAALFEPDEGRNAEKAREVLLLNDWVTPHENFLPVFDKPMFFYWLIALSYKIFGVSEWSARLPSVLAAFGCLALVYQFARKHWGPWEALWSGLILIGSVEFFILSRVVIFDMTLTFCIALALYAFYEATTTDAAIRRRTYCLLMYAALGAGTLVKGLIGLVLPGLIVFFYMLVTRQWSVLRKIDLVPGALLYFAIVAPWYLEAEARNPGFLRYYLWDEHFGRFATPSFDRSQPWYFFLGVVFVGFLPWSPMLPVVVKRHWRRSMDHKTIFLVLWTILPFIFFSVSSSKLPHYILPIFPPLAILTATTLVAMFQNRHRGVKRSLVIVWILQSLTILYLVLGLFWPAILPNQIRHNVVHIAPFIYAYALVSILISVVFGLCKTASVWNNQAKLYLINVVGVVFLVIFLAHMAMAVSPDRSAIEVAETVNSRMGPQTQLVLYDTYLTGLPFYLRTERPVWIVTHANKKKTVLGNFYVIMNRDWPDTRWGKALFDFDEFREAWNKKETDLLIVVKQKNLLRMEKEIKASPRQLTTVDEYVLLSNR